MHRAYQSITPANNKLLKQRWDMTRYDMHRKKVGVKTNSYCFALLIYLLYVILVNPSLYRSFCITWGQIFCLQRVKISGIRIMFPLTAHVSRNAGNFKD